MEKNDKTTTDGTEQAATENTPNVGIENPAPEKTAGEGEKTLNDIGEEQLKPPASSDMGDTPPRPR